MEGESSHDGQLRSEDQLRSPDQSNEPRSRNVVRKPTRMTRLTLRTEGQVKVVFDNLLEPCGPTKRSVDDFISYMGVLGRKMTCILLDSWKNVTENNKERIWQAIQDKFHIFVIDDEGKEVQFSLVDVRKQNKFRTKCVRYVGGRWTVFKTNLTSDYIYGNSSGGKKKGMLPYEKDYKFIEPHVWDGFVASRLSDDHKAKRKYFQEIQQQNKCPQKCSRGGYKLMKKKIMDDKYQARLEEVAASEDPSQIVPPPSPPSRHELWKASRKNADGNYVTEEASIIGARIESLEEQQSNGTFKSTGRNDILATTIGKPEHPGRVRGVGKGHTIRTYFGKPQYLLTGGMVSREEVDAIVTQIQEKLRAEMKMMFSSHAGATSTPETPVVESAKGSHAPCFMGEDGPEETDDECELYVEDPQKRLVAYGRLVNLGPVLHNRTMDESEVRVTVGRVVDGDAIVPIPTSEVTSVGQALKQFISWPRRLVENVAKKGICQPKPKKLFSEAEPQTETNADVMKRLWAALADITEPKKIGLDVGVVSVKDCHSMHISRDDILDFLLKQKISVPVMQLYNKYLYSVLKSSRRTDKFGLMCPLILHGNNKDVFMPLQERISQGKFQCYLTPVYDTYWQLMVICPENQVVAWFDTYGKPAKKKLIDKIQIVLGANHIMKGNHTSQLKKIQWVSPKCCHPSGSDNRACGLFVMRHMLEIIKLDIVNSFDKTLNMEDPYSDDDVADIRRRWAECFLDVTF